jgi:hypothetical protein
MGQDGREFPDMTPKAAECYAVYVSLGPKRSFAKTADALIANGHNGKRAAIIRQLERWSSRYLWQERLTATITALMDARLEQAAEIDAQSFLRTSEEIAARLEWTTPEHIDTVLKMRESVRKPVAKTPAVNVNLTVIVDDLARKYGLTEDERIALFEDMQADMKARSKAGAL